MGAGHLPEPAGWQVLPGLGEVKTTASGRVAVVQIMQGETRRTVNVAVPARVSMPDDEILMRAGASAARRATRDDRERHADQIAAYKPEALHVDTSRPTGAKVVSFVNHRGDRVEAAVDHLGHPLEGAKHRDAFSLASAANARSFCLTTGTEQIVTSEQPRRTQQGKAYVDPSVYAEAGATAPQQAAGPVLV